MRRTIFSRDSLLKWSLSPRKFKSGCTHDADQWKIPEKVLFM